MLFMYNARFLAKRTKHTLFVNMSMNFFTLLINPPEKLLRSPEKRVQI